MYRLEEQFPKITDVQKSDMAKQVMVQTRDNC